MNVLHISIDSLRRDFLSAYRSEPTIVDYAVDTPNLDRFADRAAVFDTHYAGSLPCMPARREWQTGMHGFLWRPWGPIEPFDDTLPQAAREDGILTKLITDHYHYFQHGSHGYFESFNGFDFVRGHEYDAWRTTPIDPDSRLLQQTANQSVDSPDDLHYINRAQYVRNVDAFEEDDEEEYFAPKVFSRTARWLAENRDWERWYCFVDSFDVHEPFHCPEPYASMYTDEDPRDPELPYWPHYGRVDAGQGELSERQLAFFRSQFAGKVTMADRWFGRVLDALDRHDRWEDTMVIVTSDHGFLLGDHGWLAKGDMPAYDTLAHTPLFIWHPTAARTGERIEELTAAVDLYATIRDAQGLGVPESTHSRSLLPLLEGESETHREWTLYGWWGRSMNVTDGRYTYMRPCDPEMPTDCYSTTMMNANSWFTPVRPKENAEAGAFLPYTDVPVWRFPGRSFAQHEDVRLYDTLQDPEQHTNLAGDDGEESRMEALLVEALDAVDAPAQHLDRLGLSP